MGKKQTFIVEIQDTQYDSWQGSIEWVQGQKKQAFRSTMELLHAAQKIFWTCTKIFCAGDERERRSRA